MDNSTPGKQSRAALLAVILLCIMVFCVLCILSLQASTRWDPALLIVPGVIMASCMIAWRGLEDNKDWPSVMDDELSRYIPANLEAFRALQAATLAEGELRVAEVRDWLRKEIPAMALLPPPHRKFRFAESLSEKKDGEHHV